MKRKPSVLFTLFSLMTVACAGKAGVASVSSGNTFVSADSAVDSTEQPNTFDASGLENRLKEFVNGKDARIGVAVIVNGKDTVAVNGNREFPMMSVFKFPLALVVANFTNRLGVDLNEKIDITPDELKENTYSPMLKKYGKHALRLTLRELLEWSLQESDNNTADILLKYVGGVKGMTAYMGVMDMPAGIKVGASEDDMHRDPYLSYLNLSTPIDMAELFDDFRATVHERTKQFKEIAGLIETCKTGTDRLYTPLKDTGAILGHKTGTGDMLTPGRISAVNDCGYVKLPDGQYYSIAVFVADSGYDMAETSGLIAEISEIVYEGITR